METEGMFNRIKRALESVEVHDPHMDACGMSAKAKRIIRSIIPKVERRDRSQDLNYVVGRVLDEAFEKYWKPRSGTDLAKKSGLSDETIRRLRKGDIRSGRSVPKFCEAIGVDPDAAMKGRLVKVHAPRPTEPDPLHVMLDAIRDTPMGAAIIAQIEAAHQSLVPVHDRQRKIRV
jgi:hypothetical protein